MVPSRSKNAARGLMPPHSTSSTATRDIKGV